MNYLEYKQIDVKKKLLDLVSLQMKLKKSFMNIKSLEGSNKDLVKYYITESLEKAKQLRNDLSKLR